MLQVVAVKQGLALFLQAQYRINFAARFARQQAAQELHIGRRHFHIDQEVGTRK